MNRNDNVPFLQLVRDLAPIRFGKAQIVRRCRLCEDLSLQHSVIHIRDIRPGQPGIFGLFAIIPDRATANPETYRSLAVLKTRGTKPQNILDLVHRQRFHLALLLPQKPQNRHDHIAAR